MEADRARAELRFEALALRVRLGCTAAERAEPQEVRVGVRVRFAEPPHACRTDEMDGTICYARIADLFRERCRDREFRLIERLASDLFCALRCELPPGLRLELALTKVRPPVEGLECGVTFALSD